jgi:hypothetical protein
MTQDNIKEYLKTVLENNKDISPEAIDIFKKLIDYTIKYRDELKAKTGEILTVGETRQAVDIYLEAVETERLRSGLDPKIDRLVKYWLTEINGAEF